MAEWMDAKSFHLENVLDWFQPKNHIALGQTKSI